MLQIEEIRKALQKIESDYANVLTAAKVEKAKAEAEAAALTEDLESTGKSDNPESYVRTKQRLYDAKSLVEYYDTRITWAAKNRKEAIDNLLPALTSVYAAAVKEYKAACQECITAIEVLQKASDKAAAVKQGYDAAVGGVCAALTGTDLDRINTISCYAPNLFPNMLAVNLAGKLQMQLAGMKKYVNDA